MGVDGTQAFKTSVSGIIDQLEKGKSYRTDIDSIEVTLMDQSITLSGELYFQPLSGEIVAPEGTQMDVLAATENDWYGIMMEGMFSFLTLASQLGIPLS